VIVTLGPPFDGSGDDTIEAHGAQTYFGGAGVDTIDYTAIWGGVDVLLGNDTDGLPWFPRSDGGGVVEHGDLSVDLLYEIENVIGTPYQDHIVGSGVANRLEGREGDDLLSGVRGDDTILGGAGSDTVRGGEGQDYLRGDEGSDFISGGAGFDDANGNQGDDTVSGGAGDDWVVGGKDQDLLFGDDGDDIVLGNLGNDTCSGGMTGPFTASLAFTSRDEAAGPTRSISTVA